MGGDPEGNSRIAQEGEGQEEADLGFAQAGLRQVENQDDREKTIGKEMFFVSLRLCDEHFIFYPLDATRSNSATTRASSSSRGVVPVSRRTSTTDR